MSARPGVITSSFREDRRLLDTRARRLWAALGAIALLVVPQLITSPSITQVNLILLAIIGAAALNVLMGVGHQISIGNAAFLAVGGFATGLLVSNFSSLPFLAVVALSGVAAAIVGAAVGGTALKLKGLYAVIATLALHFIVVYLGLVVQRAAIGESGFILDRPSLFGFELASSMRWYYFLIAFVAVVLFAAYNLTYGRYGRSWRMIAQHDGAAAMLGIDVRRMKVLAFAATSAVIGMQGALAGYHSRVIHISEYTFDVAVQYVAIVVIGGFGSVLGTVLGAVFVMGLPVVIQAVAPTGAISPSQLVSVQSALYGLAIILFVLFEPRGLAQIVKRLHTALNLWPYARQGRV